MLLTVHPVSLAVVALVATSRAYACLEITGVGTTGVVGTVDLQAVDEGKKVCDGHNSGLEGKGSIECNEGFSLKYDWGAIDSPLAVEFCNPTSAW